MRKPFTMLPAVLVLTLVWAGPSHAQETSPTHWARAYARTATCSPSRAALLSAGAETPTCTGTITSFPLPANRLAPYSSLRGSKHTNMATDGKRLYVTGGDWLHSATDGTWSVNLATGDDWREDVGKPVHPTLPAPHALQDGAGFVWVAAKARFLIWPGAYFPYEKEGDPLREYSKGIWWFDPATKAFTQDLGLFGKYGESSGCLFGGVYDEVNEEIVVLGDAGQVMACKRWSVKELKKLPSIPYKIAPPDSNKTAVAAYFTRSQYAKIGRHVYVVGYSTDGTKLKIPRLWRWHLDEHTLQELASPPVEGAKMRDLETRLGAAGDKVVWPFHSGPDGEIHGIYVYDTTKDVWAVDTQVPDRGNFIGNAVASLPDGRVVWSGGAFGRQQTHLWFYTPEK